MIHENLDENGVDDPRDKNAGNNDEPKSSDDNDDDDGYTVLPSNDSGLTVDENAIVTGSDDEDTDDGGEG